MSFGELSEVLFLLFRLNFNQLIVTYRLQTLLHKQNIHRTIVLIIIVPKLVFLTTFGTIIIYFCAETRFLTTFGTTIMIQTGTATNGLRVIREIYYFDFE